MPLHQAPRVTHLPAICGVEMGLGGQSCSAAFASMHAIGAVTGAGGRYTEYTFLREREDVL